MSTVWYLIFTVALIVYGLITNAILVGAGRLEKKEKWSVYIAMVILTFIIAARYNRLG